MAFEALNHAGEVGADLLVVLNDNEMSISPNVGALTRRFAELISGRLYSTVRDPDNRGDADQWRPAYRQPLDQADQVIDILAHVPVLFTGQSALVENMKFTALVAQCSRDQVLHIVSS